MATRVVGPPSGVYLLAGHKVRRAPIRVERAERAEGPMADHVLLGLESRGKAVEEGDGGRAGVGAVLGRAVAPEGLAGAGGGRGRELGERRREV